MTYYVNKYGEWHNFGRQYGAGYGGDLILVESMAPAIILNER